MRVYLHWIKCYSVAITRYQINYTAEAVPFTNQISLNFIAFVPNYIEAVKLTVLVIKKQTSFALFSSYSLTGSLTPYTFVIDFGVPFDRFGTAISGQRCITGLGTIDYFRHPTLSSIIATQFYVFVFGITQESNVNLYTFNVDCLGACSVTTFINNLPDLC